MTISLCMIVKNEEKTLPRCLDSVKEIADEIILVDTGSTDQTKQIARQYTDQIYDFKWIDDFAAARNYSFSKATKEYILWLDADDVLLDEDQKKLADLKRSLDPSFDVVMMKYQMKPHHPQAPTSVFMRERLLKRAKGFTWHDPVHEYLILSGKILNTDITVTHWKMHGKSDRNLKIFEKMIREGTPLSNRNQFYYARELFLNRRWEEAIPYYQAFLDTWDGLPSNYMDASVDLACCYRQMKDDRQVLRALLRSFEHDPPRAEICCQIGFYYKQKADYATAIFWYDLASKLDPPKNSWGTVQRDYYGLIPNIELSACYFHLGYLNLAVKYNKIAAAISPDHPVVKQNSQFFRSLKEAPQGRSASDPKAVSAPDPSAPETEKARDQKEEP
jgi:glycosyltransferase involved in cell wall biosynthesis